MAQRNRGDRGTVAVEMAIILPLFGILLLGIMEVGSIARDHQVLQNAAREGARFSALPPNQMSNAGDPTAVRQIIENRIIAYLQDDKITVSANDITVDQQYPITIGALTVQASRITITYKRPLMFSGAANLIPAIGQLQLTGRAVFRNFY